MVGLRALVVLIDRLFRHDSIYGWAGFYMFSVFGPAYTVEVLETKIKKKIISFIILFMALSLHLSIFFGTYYLRVILLLASHFQLN